MSNPVKTVTKLSDGRTPIMSGNGGIPDGDKADKHDKEIYNIRLNLLVIKEAFYLFNQADKEATSKFYEYLDTNDNIYGHAIRDNILTPENHSKIREKLLCCGIDERYLSYSRATALFDPDKTDIGQSFLLYDEANDKKERQKHVINIRKKLFDYYLAGDPVAAMLFAACYIMKNNIHQNEERYLWLASETLQELLKQDFTEQHRKSRAFASFITDLSKTVIEIEKEFPEFYAVTQKMKEEKTTQDIINIISRNLSELSLHNLSFTDIHSEAFIEMFEKMTNIMIQIKEKL